jgi:hypothetical protein
MQKARGNHCIKKILTDILSISSSENCCKPKREYSESVGYLNTDNGVILIYPNASFIISACRRYSVKEFTTRPLNEIVKHTVQIFL